MTDNTDVESPLAIAESEVEEQEARALVKNLMNRETAFIALVKESDYDENRSGNVYPPDHNYPNDPDGPYEQVEQNWIFYAKIDALSDHLYWVIVDRSGNRDTYNYGFN